MSTNIERDMQIVEHVVRNRMSVNSVIGQLFLPDSHRSAVEKITARLCKQHWLVSHRLQHRKQYFVAGARAIKTFGIPRRSSDALGPQSFPIEYGALLYCCKPANNVVRMTKSEISRAFPWYQKSWMAHPHCVCKKGDLETLEMLRIAHVGRPDASAKKCWDEMQKRSSTSAAQQAFAEGGFRLVMMVATRMRARSLQSALQKHVWSDRVEIKFSVIPELLELFTRS